MAMHGLEKLFGESPFGHLVEHARKIHECVALIRPIADAIIAGDEKLLRDLQGQMSKTEYEADLLKDQIRQHLPRGFFLSVNREDVLNYVRQLDRMGDEGEDFAVVATFRRLDIPEAVRPGFLTLVDKVVEVSNALLQLAEMLAALEKEAFEGPRAEAVLQKIDDVCRMEWESDKLSRNLARQYYSHPGLDAVTIILLDKLCHSLTGIADHAENVGKNLRLMILRR
jgi:predicted phosphate transport protein (TIGR00153 family)